MEYIKKRVIALILTCTSLVSTSCSGQETQEEKKAKGANDSIENQIKEIRKEYIRINSDSSKFRIVQEDVNDQSTEGGVLKKYYYNNVLRKAVVVFFGETGKSISECYFQNGEIFFVYQREERYKSPIYNGKTELKSQEENRYYFKDEKLIRWIGSDGKTKDNQQYSSKEKEILEDLRKIIH